MFYDAPFGRKKGVIYTPVLDFRNIIQVNNCIYMSLTCALHVNLYIFTNNIRIMTTTNDRPDLSSEGAPDIGKTVNVKQKLMSGHETQLKLESRTY
jgi:hypothetical protein